MPRTAMIGDWHARVAGHFPTLPAPTARALALASLGMAQARSGLLNTLLLALAGTAGVALNTLRQRLRAFYKDETFDPAVCFAPLLRWAAGPAGGVAPALDATPLAGRFTVLAIGVVFRGCAVPAAWAVVGANEEGSWNAHWARLLARLAGALGPGREVVALTDRGLESRALSDAIAAAGFRPLMRVKAAGRFRPDGWHRGWPMGRFAAAAGARWRGRGVAWPSAGSRLACTLVASRDAGHADAWLVLTDLAPADASAGWYAMRAWVEAGFRDLKSDGWDLSKTRMSDPARVARRWAAAAVATLWALEAGQQAERLAVPAARAHAGPGRPPAAGRFALGLAWLGLQIGRGRLRRVRPLAQPAWPKKDEPSDQLDEELWLAEL